ncbi:hypothetical protein HDU86_004558 [Geranomyces michiganensis]|nr:hypothetical protein HDU86_004558 [Geranomyces michiganensis]
MHKNSAGLHLTDTVFETYFPADIQEIVTTIPDLMEFAFLQLKDYGTAEAGS